MSKMQKYNKDFFFKALSKDVALSCTESLDKKEFDLVSSVVEWKDLPDDHIKYNGDLLDKIDWIVHIDKLRAIRIAISNLAR